MISLASSFQCRQPRSISITLAPTNPRRTFAYTKFRWAFPVKLCTSGANGQHPGVSLVELYIVMGRSRESDIASVIFPNSGESSATPASSSVTVVHLWPKVSTPSRSSRRFLSIFPFNLQFCGRSHLIPLPSLFSTYFVRAVVRRLPTASWTSTPRASLDQVAAFRGIPAPRRSLRAPSRRRWFTVALPPVKVEPASTACSVDLWNPATTSIFQRE
jgi:hypothetical protein